ASARRLCSGNEDVLLIEISRIAQRTHLATSEWLSKVERVSSQEVDVLEDERRESLDVLWPNLKALALQLAQRTFHVARVPQDDGVHDQAQSTEFVLLAFAIALAHLPTLAVKDGAGEAIAPFSTI